MNNATKVSLVALATLALVGSLGAAHARNYVASIVSGVCLDDSAPQPFPGGLVGGAINGALAAAWGQAEPTAPDTHGSCYGPGHIAPNANGDVTFSASDAASTASIGMCVTQDSNDDGFICANDDPEERIGCGQVTVNVADGFDFANRVTNVWLDELPQSHGVYIALFGDASFCQNGVDGYPTTGTINHS